MKAILLLLFVALPARAGDLPPPIDPAGYSQHSMEEFQLGRLLFYDPILSGNRNISCASCHHPRFATGDGLSLGLGEGGTGLGPDRHPDPMNMPEQRIPRNAPPLFNLGHRDVTVLFHDGRIEADPDRPSGLRTPLEDEMVQGFASLLSAQTMFPVLSPDEMAGHYQENDVAKLVRQGRLTGPDGAWDTIAGRVADIPEYARRFTAAYPEIAAGRDIDFTDISDAIAAFMAHEWRADDSLFDRYLRGETTLGDAASDGLALFTGSAGCATCHSGPLLSDMSFHAMAAPQLGPGKAERFENHQRDIGRLRVTGRAEDAYAFRTPMLRNVTETGPWGHAGAHDDLRGFLRDHADPGPAIERYRDQSVLPRIEGIVPDFWAMENPVERAAIAAAANPGTPLDERELDALMAFLGSLTDRGSIDGRLGIPDAVPSGLPVDR
ncbi:cytochrome-c peroxidase [Palleronia sp. LCG004]|uniref:cytochrome-c peroxidase n=1 Tax=Palleronia sp. LCG004 TaxID=3079304 RepID=UPI002943AB49|nr:cytochrome-c peroxidase [Palleronia sp. LCG004]WOI56402.1 cytochrome-c peroxidase [Palleronia sp. LCG004]